MIYLCTEAPASLGEDTFWTWFHREFPDSTFAVPAEMQPGDIALVNCARNDPPTGGKSIGLVFELYPEMKRFLNTHDYDHYIQKMRACASKCNLIAATSHTVVDDYADCGPVKVVPLGLNTDLFKPMANKEELRRKYGLPLNKKVIFWSGTGHPMKGYDMLLEYNRQNPGVHWVIVWKQRVEGVRLPNSTVFCPILI